MYFDLLAEMVRYVKKVYPEDKFTLTEHDMKLYSVKLWTCEALIQSCTNNQIRNPLTIIEEFIDYHEIVISEMDKDSPKREYFSTALMVAYQIRSHLRQVFY